MEIRQNDISAYWKVIAIGLVEVPSKSFTKLKIETQRLDFNEIEFMASAIILRKNRISVEVRCNEFLMKPVILMEDGKINIGKIKEYRSYF